MANHNGIPTLEDFISKGRINIPGANAGDQNRALSGGDARYYQNFVNTAQGFKDSGDTDRYNATLAIHGFNGGNSAAPDNGGNSGGGGSGGNGQSLQQTWQQKQAEAAALSLSRGNDAYAGGLDKLRESITYNGFNPDDYTTQIERYLGGIKEGIPQGDLSPSQYYTGDLYNPWKTGVEQQQITGYQNELNNFLSPGFANNLVDSNLGDNYLNGIVDQQQQDATDAITRARDRGILNTTGFDRGMADLTASRPGGYQRLDGIRDGITAGYKDQLRGQANQARDKLNTYTLGDTFNTQGVQDSINSYYDNLKDGFEGDFSNAFGGAKLFDYNKNIQQGGVSQGVTRSNLTAPGFLQGLNDRAANEGNTRGLGNTGGGVF